MAIKLWLSFNKHRCVLQMMTAIRPSILCLYSVYQLVSPVVSQANRMIPSYPCKYFADKPTCNLHPMSGNTSSWERGRGILASDSGYRGSKSFLFTTTVSDTSISYWMRYVKISDLVKSPKIQREEAKYWQYKRQS